MSVTLDRAGRPVVAVTGLGIVTSLGQGKVDNWAALTTGQSGIHQITRFSVDGLKTKIAGTVDFLDVDSTIAPFLSRELAVTAVREAIEDAAIGSKGSFPGPLFMAVPPVELGWPERLQLAKGSGATDNVKYSDLVRAAATGAFRNWNYTYSFGTVATDVAEKFGTRGSPISLSTACSSGATAIQLGVEAIRRGETDAALCVGTEGSVQTEALIRFSLLSALSMRNETPKTASRPFSKDRDGFVMGEGAAALVLENYDAAKARGAAILGVVAGYGEMGDNFHRTRSTPSGSPLILAMQRAIADANCEPDQIDAINAHGTSTPENDKMEAMSCAVVFGDRMKRLPISSNKSMIGHTLTAAGAIEAVVSLLTMRHSRIPPTINYNTPDPAIAIDVVPNVARDMPVNHIMSNSFGFGGQNTCLVFAREPS
jgi:3-oxoacyl-[acyl-carrier-protein] synthase II